MVMVATRPWYSRLMTGRSWLDMVIWDEKLARVWNEVIEYERRIDNGTIWLSMRIWVA